MTNTATSNNANAAELPTRETRRTLNLLIAAQSLGGASPPIIISLGGIVGLALADDPTLATLPVSVYSLGLALSTIPAALLMRRLGRRAAYLLGAILGVFSGIMAAFGIIHESFAVFCAGTALAGFYAACVQNYRFAASDIAAPSQRARAISQIMVGGLIAAIIGPQVVIWTRDALPAAPFAGSFFGQAALALLALPLLAKLHAPPPKRTVADGQARPLATIMRSPRFIVAVTAGVVTYGLMSLIMTAAPIAMVGRGHSIGHAALGIQWHVLAMFGPSFFTGRLISRFGKITITALGLALIAAAGLLAITGVELLQFWGTLILLGVGWNFGFIGATAMVTDCYNSAEQSKVQAVNDFLIFGTAAIASFSSGQLLSTSGWNTINILMLPLITIVLLMLAALAWQSRKQPTFRY